MKLSIASRLIGFFTLISLLALGLLGSLLAQSVKHHFDEMDLAELQSKQHQVRFYTDNLTLSQDQLIQQLKHLLPVEAGWYFVLFDQNQNLIFSSLDLAESYSLIDVGKGRLTRIEIDQQSYVTWRAQVSEGQTWSVVALKNIEHHEHFMQMFLQFLVIGSLITLLIMIGLGWLVIGHGLKSLKHFSQLATKVSSQYLTERLDLSSLPLELRPVGRTFNEMLARLESAFLGLNQFSADLAHEFRTPITNLMMQSQVALSQPRDIDEYQEILSSNIEEFERLSRMVNDMLLLAKTDQGIALKRTEQVLLHAMFQQLIDYFELLATERGIVFSLKGEAQIQADSTLLRRALANVLANAVRHADSHSTITITIINECKQTQICICNQGQMIASEHLEKLFDRFYRVESERSNQGGSGLGLSITLAIIKAHEGHIFAESNSHETCFNINLKNY